VQLLKEYRYLFSTKIFCLGYIFAILVIPLNSTIALPSEFADTSKTKTILELPQDTTKKNAIEKTKDYPGGETIKFLPYQDSAYQNTMNLHIAEQYKFKNDLRKFSDLWLAQLKELEKTPYKTAIDNINNIPQEYLLPSQEQVLAYQYNILQSQSVPFVRTLPTPGVGLQASMQDIAVFFGVAEDVSPTISYSIDFTCEVEVVVYSVQAVVVATIYKGMQTPGNYKLTWNLKDDYGRKMPSGDYIAEVRISNIKFIRKRIVIQ